MLRLDPGPMRKRPVKQYTAPDLAGIAVNFRSFDIQTFESCLESCRELVTRLTEAHNLLSFAFMVDFPNQRYLHMGRGVYNMMGYSPDDFYREGLRMAFETAHPDDLVILKSLHQKLFSIYYETPIPRRKDLKFAFNLRVRKADGEYIHILQQTIFLGISDTGEPLFDFSTVTDITEFMKDNVLTLTVSELNVDGVYEQKCKQDFRSDYPKFTARQQQILDLIGKGRTTREIAEDLCISVDTVKNHRKKILQLAGSKKIVEVVRAQR